MKRFGFLLLLFAPLLQAQMAVGPERFVCEPRFVTPNAADVAAATNGIETLVAFQPYGVESSIYAQRLDANAQPLTPHGFPVARGTRYLGGVASNHDGYVVFWVTVREAWTTYVDAAGNAAAPQRVVTTPNIIFWPRIASNGTGYLAAWT